MEVLKSGDVPAVVTNIEVMNILSKRIEKRNADASTSEERDDHKGKENPKLRHRDFIEEKVLEYLHTTPCANADIQQMPELISKLIGDNNGKTPSNIQSSPKEMDTAEQVVNKGYGLVDAEILQILNHMPTEKVEAHLMIEHLENRMDDDRQDQLLQLVSEYLGVGHLEEEEEEIIEEQL